MLYRVNLYCFVSIFIVRNHSADVRSRRPLRAAQIVVQDVAGDPGWYQVSLAVRPHFKYMGANFEISLVGRLDTQ